MTHVPSFNFVFIEPQVAMGRLAVAAGIYENTQFSQMPLRLCNPTEKEVKVLKGTKLAVSVSYPCDPVITNATKEVNGIELRNTGDGRIDQILAEAELGEMSGNANCRVREILRKYGHLI